MGLGSDFKKGTDWLDGQAEGLEEFGSEAGFCDFDPELRQVNGGSPGMGGLLMVVAGICCSCRAENMWGRDTVCRMAGN